MTATTQGLFGVGVLVRVVPLGKRQCSVDATGETWLWRGGRFWRIRPCQRRY